MNGCQVFQNLSRANFSAERGIRYGADFYDARMQATRICRISVPAVYSGTADASLAQQKHGEHVVEGNVERDMAASLEDGDAGGLKEKEGLESIKKGSMTESLGTACFVVDAAPSNGEKQDASVEEKEEGKRVARDPLRMFGLLTPSALKEAQRGSIKVVEGVVSKLVTIDAEMKQAEIRIRRARKWKAKAEAKEDSIGEKGVNRAVQRQEITV